MNDNLSFSLDRLLAWLDDDSHEAGRKYVIFHKELIGYLERHGAYTVAEEMTDEVFNRVDKQLASALLSEHFNSTEIADVTNLCRNIRDNGAKDALCPGGKIWKLLSFDEQMLVAELAETEKFKRSQRSFLSQALNKILSHRNFYSPEDFNLPTIQAEANKNIHIQKIEADITRGLPKLSQKEIEQFNRRLLEAAYPQIIKTNLADTPDTEKLARCKRYARNVLLEYQKKPAIFIVPTKNNDESNLEESNPNAVLYNPFGSTPEEDEEEKQRKLACQKECKNKLSPRDSEILELYFTGKIILSSAVEPLSDDKIRGIIKTLGAKYELSPNTIRTIVYRCKTVMLNCIEKCLKWQKKN